MEQTAQGSGAISSGGFPEEAGQTFGMVWEQHILHVCGGLD